MFREQRGFAFNLGFGNSRFARILDFLEATRALLMLWMMSGVTNDLQY